MRGGQDIAHAYVYRIIRSHSTSCFQCLQSLVVIQVQLLSIIINFLDQEYKRYKSCSDRIHVVCVVLDQKQFDVAHVGVPYLR